jgi:glyoxalase family protein
MPKLINSIHHITAMADDPQKNINFYTGVLGLRLVKKTINFDAPDVYHLYYGDETGSPGSILTFFPYTGIARGRKGKGQMTVTGFSIPAESIPYWLTRLTRLGIAHQEAQERFNETYIYLEDPDGLGLELVANDQDKRKGFTYGHIPLEHSIRGFYQATLSLEGYERTAGLLTATMEHQLVEEKGNRFRYSTGNGPGSYIDLLCEPETLRGLGGGGTVHHLAFSTDNDETQKQMQEQLSKAGRDVTPVLDRQYFHSVYFREPGGILFEIATDPPGFAADEEPAHLGEALKLPRWYEPRRAVIEKGLTPVYLPDFEQYKS